MTTQPDGLDVYTAVEGAAIIKVSPNWMRDAAREGRISCTMVGGSYHFTGAHLREALRLFERPAAPVAALAPRVPARRRNADIPEIPVLRARPPRRRNAA